MHDLHKRYVPDKKKLLREQDRLTRPPRLEGVVKEAMMQPIRKRKKPLSRDHTQKERRHAEIQKEDYQLEE